MLWAPHTAHGLLDEPRLCQRWGGACPKISPLIPKAAAKHHYVTTSDLWGSICHVFPTSKSTIAVSPDLNNCCRSVTGHSPVECNAPSYAPLQHHLSKLSHPPIPIMSYKQHDQGLAPGLMDAREKEVMDEIDKLIDRKLHFALARIIPGDPDAARIVEDPEIKEQANNLKTAVAAVVERHESIISTIAKSKKDKDNEKPV